MPSTNDEDQYNEGDGDDGNELLEFLKLNQNIKQLHIRDINISSMILNLIKSFQNLTHLYLSDYKCFSDINIASINSSVQINLSYLEIYLPIDNGILHTLTRQFPNLTGLNIISLDLAFSSLCSTISNFKKLKNLKLVDYIQFHESNKLDIQNFENLQSIEFLAYVQTKFELFNFNVHNCSKLKFIKFKTYDYAEEFEVPDLSPELKNWRLVYFPRKLSFYRINQ
ncbi:hypothetical protein CONCODRAFT_73213 [Conidiobolus coronatus NRRL 28638]|uniref:RNI-like protein n=1 Tax=Conidiobolus coronatus (strain ATCC 28846 / CBS 209.66 / NRRL 28638) TaxID=796925 RepID=A0A137NWB3_CONC2|nr:hypothetical protein CONCODRAFT_73213 [Conidiobolus coronatus NRRL 28638]|eukprot:KXN67125.1 hypothetical protein CONCODRAFT_73213 [Conidiobolus coronatus NRRL 28638]